MKDIDKLKNLLTEFGIGFSIKPTLFETIITIEFGMSKVIGHSGCSTEFYFSNDGTFNQAGAWK